MMVFNDTLLKAISWTLVHSVWQGFVLALVAGLVILATKKSASVLRYHLLTVLFVGFLVVSGITFYYEANLQQQESLSTLNLPLIQAVTGEATHTGIIDYRLIASDFLNQYSSFIVTIWFLIFIFKALQICNGFGQIYRIRNYKTFAPSDYWNGRIAELAGLIGLQKSVVLLESALVKVPSVSGILRPVILMPIGMLSGFPHDQVEAILLHELAHIRRKDYIINILQRLAEMVFFFNPGLLWLSNLIRDERENCCDDIAVEAIGNKSGFVHALVSFGQYQLRQEQLVMGLGDNKSHLFHRAKRIIYNNNTSLNAIEKTFLSVSLLLIALALFAFNHTDVIHTDAAAIEAERIHADRERMAMDAQMANEEVKMRNEEAKRIAQESIVYSDETARYDEEQKKYDANQQKYEANQRKYEAEQAKYNARQKMYEDQNKYCIQEPTVPQPLYGNLSPLAKPVSLTKTTHTQIYARDEETRDTDDPTYYKKVSLRSDSPNEYFKHNGPPLDNLTNNITSDLIAANVIQNTENLSYKLSPGSLIVNGVKQPESVHARFKNKYVKANRYAICYNYEITGDLAIDSK
ncbi:MAG: M56 family metallopeptidase [Flavobacterium sp.]